MSADPFEFDEKKAVDRLMRFLSVEGVTGREGAIARAVARELADCGVPKSAIRFDRVHRRIPLPTETGNLIVTLPGTRPGPRRMFSTHLDTVPLCAGVKPVRRGDRIEAAGETALGGDNRTGVGVLVTLAATLVRRRLLHPPLTLLFTVREESGLWGARFADPRDLGRPAAAFNVDGHSASEIITGAVGADRWNVEIVGRASHAGAHPELGISATAVASLALADIYHTRWFGRVRRNGKAGTSNVGVFGGKDGPSAGDATNVVTDYVFLRGESRSHDLPFAKKITAAYRKAFREASRLVRDVKGRCAQVRFRAELDYLPFQVPDEHPVVQHAMAAALAAGNPARTRLSNGGLDANWLVRRGIPTVTFGAGQNSIHSVGEWVDVGEYRKGCRLAIALATVE